MVLPHSESIRMGHF